MEEEGKLKSVARRKKEEGQMLATVIKMKREEKFFDELDKMPEIGEEDEDLVEIFIEDAEVTIRVTTTLRDHYGHWKETGASAFSLGVIREGYKIELEGCPDNLRYKEKNNTSYKNHKEFANEAVIKMEEIKVVKKVKKEPCRFISPLTVAVNKVGKKRLSIDLSRGLNMYLKTRKFKSDHTRK